MPIHGLTNHILKMTCFCECVSQYVIFIFNPLICFVYRVGQAGTELSRVTEEFNEMFGGQSNEVAWHWFFPLSVDFPRGMQKVVMGFEWDETFDATPYEEPQGHRDVEMGTVNVARTNIDPSTTASSQPPPNNKEKNSEHDNPDDTTICAAGTSQTLKAAPLTGGGATRLTKRGNSRDRHINDKDPLLKGTLT